jgi:multimeric flavodoxin WrbA
MSKKVLVICGSPYVDSNSDTLAEAFAEGALESRHTVETVKLPKLKLGMCLGCDHCRQADWECIQHDDMQGLYKLVQESDVIALATPLYFLTVSAHLKTFIDRLYCKHHAGKIRGKKSVLLSSSGGPGSAVLTDYFAAFCSLVGWENAGGVAEGGLRRGGTGPSEAKKMEAYELGKSI